MIAVIHFIANEADSPVLHFLGQAYDTFRDQHLQHLSQNFHDLYMYAWSVLFKIIHQVPEFSILYVLFLLFTAETLHQTALRLL